MLSVNGIITFKNAKNITEIIEHFPLENILLETDSPYLAPVPHRGKTNSSLYLKHVCEGLANLKKTSPQEIASITTKNAKNFFNLW